MRRLGLALLSMFLLGLAAGSAWAQGKEPILLRDMGSFHVGGRVIEISGQPIKEIVFTPGGVPAKMDPNGKYQVARMYVQYFLPQNRRGRLPLLMWHGGGLTGVTYETTPDDREGWLTYFIRKGWDTYISDAVERGRAGWTDTFKGDALSLPLADPRERCRVGPPGSWNDDKAKRTTYSGVQFPIEAYEQFMKQGVPRWLTTDDQIVAAYIELVDKVCPCVVMVHSQSGRATGCWRHAPIRSRRWSPWSRRWAAIATRCNRSRRRRSWSLTAIMQKIILDGRRSARAASITPLFSNPRRQHRRGRSAGGRHQGQFTHDDDGQEQQSGRRPHPEMVARQRIGAMSASAAAAQH